MAWGAHQLLEKGAAGQAGDEEKQETGSLDLSALCHRTFRPVVQAKDLPGVWDPVLVLFMGPAGGGDA